MKLNFSNEEQKSINFLVQCLIKADGLILPEENVCWNTVSLKMGWDENNKVLSSETYDVASASAILCPMDDDKKLFASAFFTMIILADQKNAPEEAELMQEITLKANLPVVSANECANILEKFFN